MIKILTHFAHSSYQTALSTVPDTKYFHVVDPKGEYFDPNACPKNFWSKDDPLPRNIVPIHPKDVADERIDLILVHWHPFIEQFRNLWQKIPMIMLEHTWPYLGSKGEALKWKNLRDRCCEHAVFITPSSRDAWGYKDTPLSYIYHSIDVDHFPQKIDYTGRQIMTTTNEFINRDWATGFSIWTNVLGVPGKAYFDDIALYGYGNSNIGPVAKGSRARVEILDLLKVAGVYFNPAPMSPIPMSLLEAAAVGTPIVSVAYCEAGKIFEDGVHGIISNDTMELRHGIKYMLDNPDDAERMAKNARERVKELFDPIRFQCEWNELFNRVKTKGRKK